MKKARNLWRDLPQGGSRYGSVLTRLFLLLCLLATTQAGWAQTTQTAIYASGYENGAGEWSTNGGLTISSNTTTARTGSKSITLSVDNTSAKSATQSTSTSMSSTSGSIYCHVIGWAKAASGSNTKAQIGFNSSKKSNATSINSENWTRLTYMGNSINPNTIILYKSGATTDAYVDDIVAYYNGYNTTDLTAPSAPTIGTASTSGISWTNGSDTGTGATGIQQTLIFKRSSGSADDLTLNNQGIYSLTATEGPSTDQSGHWTLVATVADPNATLYSGTLSEGRYAIVHRDLAYNYSAATYTTVSGGGSTPVDLTDQQFAWSAASSTATIGESNTFPTLTNSVPVDVTYSATTTAGGSTNSEVASIDNLGNITLNKAGTAYINAIFAGSSSYNAKTVTYTLTVNAAASALAISTQPVGASYNQNASATALTVAATGGTGSYSYQWYSNTASSTTTPTPTAVGTNSASYTPSTATVGTTYYYCKVTDAASATVNSTIVAITVKGAAENEPSSPATTTYASKTFLNVSGTKANGELSDGSKDFLTYGARNIGYTVKPSWYSGTNSKWDSGVTGNITGSGFLPFGSSSSYDNYTSTYGGLKLKASSSTFYVTGTTGVAIYASGSSSTSPLTKIDLTVEEVYSDGTTHAVGTTASTPTNNTLTIVEHGSVLDATKYYKVTATADNDKECHLVQIRFTKSSTTVDTYAVTCATGIEHGSISSNVAKAAEGTDVTITATPDPDYYLSNLSVTQTDTNTPVSTTGTGNSRTFTMPNKAVTVTATFTAMPSISITKTPTDGGNVTISPDGKAAPGTMVTINAEAASTYSVGTITVKDAGNNNITVTDNQFTMPNSNVTVTVTFNKAAVSAGDKWNFTTMSDADKAAYQADDTKWNTSGTDYYGNQFTPAQNTATDVISEDIQQIKNLKFIRTSGNMKANDVRIYLPTSTAEGYLKFNGNGRGLIIDKSELSTGDKVTVDFIGGSASKGFTITNGSVDAIKSATRTSAEFTVTDGDQDLQLVVNDGAVKLYKITIGQAVDVAEPSFDKADGSGYDGTGDLSVTVTTKETGEGTETTYWKYATTALDRDALVATGATEGTATITAANVNQQAIVLSAVTQYVTGTNTYYSDVVTATYPYTGKYTPSMTSATILIQQGDRHTIEPEITLPDGSKFNPEEDTQNEGKSSIHDYFDFTYKMTAKTGTATQYITLDGNADLNVTSTGGVVNTKIDDNKAEVGDRATIHIVATKKFPFEGTWPFASDQCETDVTIEVIEKVKGAMMKFYWDPEFKNEVSTTEPNEEWGMEGTLTVFKGQFSNGRMFYVKPEPGYKVYVAAGVSDSQLTASKVDGISKSGTVYKYPYRKNDPTDAYPDAPIEYNGIPLLVDDFGGADTKTYYLALVTYNSEGKPEGSAVNAKFTIKNDETKRPGNVTFDPSENNATRNTAQTVLTQGVEGAYVYGKFSGTGTSYNTHTLIQEPGINGGQTNVGVFSTEVDKRKISALQIAKNADGFYYMGTQKTNTYEYMFASEISLKSNTYTTNVYNGEGAAETVDVKALIDKITYYNKDSKKDINIADSIQAHSGETAPVTTKEIDRVTYTIQYFNGAGGTGVTDGTTLDGGTSVTDGTTLDANGVVTIGRHSGYVVVTATYPGGYKKKVNSRTNVTDVSKATYTIYLVNPDEQIPTITPASRNFVDEQSFIIQAPANWNALYMVVEEKDANYDAQTATYSSDDPKVGMLEKGEYIRLTVTKTSKVRAFAYDPSVTEHNVPGQANTTSKEVTATYTKLDPLKAPTLSPYGTSEEPHIRTAKSLTVIATTNDPYAGLEVYYTLDGSDPTPTTGEKYNGSEKINISGASTTIKAITYRPETGQISPVTTGVYMYTGSIKQPKFQVNGSGDYTSGNITVSPGDEITIISDDGGDIYYTLDGATPTTADAVPYTTSFTIVKNTTGKAIAVKEDASSPITTVNFMLTEEKDDLWEAVEETTPGGKLDANDRYVAVGNSGNSSTKAVKYLTATFGGMDAAGWNKTSIGEKTQGTPLDGVGKYSISTTRDVWDETDAEVKNTASTVHGKTFALPAKGNFVRFEPERDGDLTIWLLQQGGLHYTDDGDLCNQFIRLRPVYMFDEKGNSITATDIKSSARLSDNWNDLDVDESKDYGEGRHGNWVAKDKSQNGVVNKYYTEGESEAIYNMYKKYLTNHDISAGAPIVPFATTGSDTETATVQSKLVALGLNGTGYVMPSGGNVKYTFHVEGGKSYYFFGYRTKLAIRGFQFTPSNGQDVETLSKNVTINDDTSNATSGFDNNICNVTYTRAFTNGKWAAVTFPFNVSVAQMKKVFGNQVDLIHFDNVSGSKINFKRHWYPMIVAGTPVFIKPSQDMGASVTFEGVHIEAETVNEVSGEGGYKMTGSFIPATINVGDYYISGGKLAVRKGNSINTNACRSWLTADSNTGARFDLTTGTADAFAEEAWSVIGNPQPFVASDETITTYINGVQEDGIINNIFDGPTGIYTINGQLIRKDATSLEGLSKGIYIVNGKKIAIK